MKRTLTDGVAIDRMFRLWEAENDAVAEARLSAENRARARFKKRRADLMKTIPEQRHARIHAAVEAMLKALHPVVEESDGEG